VLGFWDDYYELSRLQAQVNQPLTILQLLALQTHMGTGKKEVVSSTLQR
jgi:hypothetical protein